MSAPLSLRAAMEAALARRRSGAAVAASPPPADWCAACQAAPCLCAICHGAGVYRVDPGGGRLSTYPECPCRAPARRAAALAALDGTSALRSVGDLTFATWRPRRELREAEEAARGFAAAPSGFVVLAGSVGTGKTHLAAAVGHELRGRGVEVSLLVVPDLIGQFKRNMGPGAAADTEELLDSVQTIAVLILDDLGAEQSTDWARSVLYRVIEYRYRLRLPTIVTTNNHAGLEPRIKSRIGDMALGRTIVVRAADYRRLPESAREGNG